MLCGLFRSLTRHAPAAASVQPPPPRTDAPRIPLQDRPRNIARIGPFTERPDINLRVTRRPCLAQPTAAGVPRPPAYSPRIAQMLQPPPYPGSVRAVAPPTYTAVAPSRCEPPPPYARDPSPTAASLDTRRPATPRPDYSRPTTPRPDYSRPTTPTPDY